MNMREVTNIIIALRNEGWDADKINNFLGFIETHNPTENEVCEYDFTKKKDS